MLKRILVIANPTAGRRLEARLQAVVLALRSRGCEVRVRSTAKRGDAERFAAGVDRKQFDLLAVAGGDGTINEVLNGVRATAPPLAVMPFGTANVLAIEIGLASSTPSIVETLVNGRPRPINLGLANGRRFAVMASAGFDAEVVAKVRLDLKRYFGKGAYLYEAVHQFLTFQASSYRVRIDGTDYPAAGVVIANGRHYGGRFVVAPAASLEMPGLHVCRCLAPGRFAMARYAVAMITGRLAERPDYRISEATHVEIDGPAGAAMQADGDILTRLPVTIESLPDAVELIFPPIPTPGSIPSPDREAEAAESR